MNQPKKFPEPQAFHDKPRPNIALKPVESSQVAAIGYDPATRTLAVTFKRGQAIYHYEDVPPETHESFLKAESLGTFFGKHIKALPFKKYAAEKAGA